MTVLITAAGAVAEEPRPADATGTTAWFDPAAHLGRRGWKYLSPATRYLLAAGNQALGRRHDAPPLTGDRAERFGVVTGTQYAIAGVHRRMDDILTTEGVQGISPAQVPAFSMNTPASQLAISTGARAFSVTLTNPVTAGLEAVQFAATALRTGRADRVVAAATDQAPAGDGGRDRYDAAAAVVLSGPPAGAGALAEITGGISRFVPPDAADGRDRAALAASGERIAALARGAKEVRLVVSAPAAAARFGGAVRDAVARALAAAGGSVRDPAEAVGEARHCAVSGLLELIALARRGGTGLVVSASESGHLTAIALDDPVHPEFH
ncbi:beta-ketoacyl synthase N-terminal-like domain-containing protein [Streptomyces sp. DH37]|uniref:beta-ketoacyl synthase N-terminal-like domain-containing protein n=1 Tax=Streptomyces sp. DH37 TaxID=3040122 RepID=UPI0024412FBF|nr:beta-ketoacyl synthase N-terminal-like domain-containing protein [Streptomyces sp. DH37]MDG9705865.1 beta-ketoacyl synthase N-terminal-like domain-containing protein [Streptomyces sp. DH37]